MRIAIGSLGLLVYLAVYIALVATLADLVPARWWVQLGFYAAAGVIWALPLRPVLAWMQEGRGDPR